MAFLGVKDIIDLQQKQGIIEPFEESRIKNAAYELSLGSQVYSTDSESKKVEFLNDTNRNININPGQFALLLTKEKVNIPKDKLAFISIKAGEKLKGLVNVSGFHVDPGFNDHLLFSVYNAGPGTIVLSTGEPYFPIWFAELKEELSDDNAYGKENEHYKKFHHIPAKYVEWLKRGDLASPSELLKKINTNQSLLKNVIWAAGITIALGISLTIKSLWDVAKFNEGYYVGLKEKEAKAYIYDASVNYRLDSIVKAHVDSILNRSQNDTTYTKK